MDYQILKIDISDNIAIISIDRPEALTAPPKVFVAAMDRAVEVLSSSVAVRVVIITGAGKAFVAGADIAEMVDMTQEEGRDFGQRGQRTFKGLEKMEKPVIAAINGFALGGGLELAMACDFRIASNKARFGQPEVNLGMIPGYAGTQRLPRLVGLGDALFLLMSGEMIRADEALRIGLVQKVVEPEELMAEAGKIAGIIASRGPLAVSKVKYVTRQGMMMNFDDASGMESDFFGSQFKGEGEEGMKAFLEKRKPDW